MVRYPHTAELHVQAGSIVDGEWQEGSSDPISIKGRFESRSNTYIPHESGDRIEIKAEFFTKANKPMLKLDRLVFDGREYKIVVWNKYQKHSVLWLS